MTNQLTKDIFMEILKERNLFLYQFAHIWLIYFFLEALYRVSVKKAHTF